jgi:hypothetical protein
MTRRKDPKPDTVDAETTVTGVESLATVAEPIAVAADPVGDPEPAEPPPAPMPPAAPQRSSMLGPLLGGALAALGGFGLSHFNLLGLATPGQSIEVAGLTRQLEEALSRQALAADEMRGQIASTTTRVATLEAAPVPEVPDLSRLDDLDRRLAVIEALPAEGGASTAALAAKLAELERRMTALPTTGAAPELQAELDAALARLNAAEAAATARATEAEAAALAARREKALDGLAEAVATGGPFVAALQALDDPELSAVLAPMAEAGVPTLAKLRADFPDAAREVLRTAREISTEDGWGDRLVDFLAMQTEARSLTPREGDDPDAVLARAEFALSKARVADALAELEPLDPALKPPLEPWITDATAHLAAETALQAARGK